MVQVQAAPKLPRLIQLRVHSNDANSSETTAVPQTPELTGLILPATFVVKLPGNATALSVLVEGLGETGQVVGRGAASAAFGHGQGATVGVTLTQACGSSLDCDPTLYCLGQEFCGDAGACLSQNGSPLATASPCLIDGGSGGCYQSACHATVCGDGLVEVGEQCDLGAKNSDTGECTSKCQWARCGDGLVNQEPQDGGAYLQELCDLGDGKNGKGLGCNANCESRISGIWSRLAGMGSAGYKDGPGSSAEFNGPAGLAVVGETLFVADSENALLRAIDLSSDAATVTTVAGSVDVQTTVDGQGTDAGFDLPLDVLPFQGSLVVSAKANLRQVSFDGGVSTLAGPASDDAGFADEDGGPLSAAAFDRVTGLATDGFALYAVDQGNDAVREVSLGQGAVTTLSGPATTPPGAYSSPTGLVLLDGGLLIGDTGHHELQRLDLKTLQPSVVAGSGASGFVDGTGSAARFGTPAGLCTDGRVVYVVDSANAAVRQFDPDGLGVITVAGGPDAGAFAHPYGCAFDPDAGVLYVSDQANPSTDAGGNALYRIR